MIDERAGAADAAEHPAPGAVTPPGQAGLLRRALEIVVVGTTATALAAWLYRIWDRSLSIPMMRDSDVQIVSEIVRTIDRHGWYLRNPDVGAPFGQQLYDFPHAGETLQLLMVRTLGLFTDRFGVIVNSYYLLGFGLLAAVTYAVFRQLRFSPGVAGVVALLYTFLPYHFAHGEGHLFRSTYYSAPLAALVVLWVLSFRAAFLRATEGRLWPWPSLRQNVRWPRFATAVVLCVIIGTTETMTIAFTLTALGVSCAIVAVRDRSAAQLVVGLVAIGVIAGAFGVAFAPNLAYQRAHGSNERAARRLVAEQELYGLRISQMVLPTANHRLAWARDLTARTNDQAPLAAGESGQALGVLGTLGLVAVCGSALVLGVPRRTRRPVDDRGQLLRHGGLVVLILILFGAASGFAVVLDLLGFSQIRVWDRVVVLIAFFSMVAVAIGLERAVRRIAGRFRSRVPVVALLLVVACFGLWDTTGRTPPPSDDRIVEEVRSLDAALEHRLPTGAAIFQLPVVEFPESPPRYGAIDYDEFLPYLWSEHLRWSYGAVKGRPEADWQAHVDSDDPTARLAALRGLGFDGILVDSAAYADHGAAVTARLSSALGPPEVVSSRGRWKFWDLRDYAHAHDLTNAQLARAARRLVGVRLANRPAAR